MATPIDFIIGLPPDNLHEDTNVVLRNSMPLCRIYPGVPSYTEGITLFRRRSLFSSSSKGEASYLKLLADQGFTLNQFTGQSDKGYLTVAFQADSFPTDSFTNEYGENFLQSFTDVASEKAASLMQIMGKRSAGEALSSMVSSLKKGGTASRAIGTGLETAQKTAGDVIRSLPGGGTISGGINLVSALAAGSRIDFPMLWKTSGFQPSYTMTIRLYNPNPSDSEATEKYIIGPIAALMLLGIPISQDGKTYSWPFIHRIEAPGIYDLDPAFISNITVIKGGDQQQISYPQKMGVVDVRIDFGSLFNSILAGRKSSGRPTLYSYLKAMRTSKGGIEKFSSTGQTLDEIESRLGSTSEPAEITRNQAPTTSEPTTSEKQNPPDRVSSAIKSAADSLINQIPTGFKISTS
ncbi:MAG: hypothetical protein ACFFG0_02020 [Candidatus Thorarchaeota archaeon]